MRGERYPKYKPTGIAWLPEVPEEWEYSRIGRLFELRDEKNLKPIEEVTLLSLYTDKGVIRHDDVEKTTGNKAVRAEGYKVVHVDDIVVNIILCWMGAMGRSAYNGVTSPAYDVYRARNSGLVLTRYYHYLFRTPKFAEKCYQEGRGIMMMRWRTYSTQFKAIGVPFPDINVQRAIVAYLDEKCGKVDRLVAAKEKEAALLKELKQSMIAEAVTGATKVARTDTARKMKPSGIPWLPEVPEGWEVKKVRQHFRLRAEKVSEKGYPPLSVAKIGVVPQLSDVALSMAEGDTRKLVRAGDYVVNSRSDRKGSCGIAPRDGSVTTISIVLEPRDIEKKFVHYLFRSVPWVEEFYRNGRGIVADLWTTRYQEMRNMMFPLPSLAEQREIVAHIEARAAKIDAAVKGLEREVAALKEYKQRLIADVVTGQRKVA